MNGDEQVKSYSVRQITKDRFGVDSQSDPAKSYTIQRVPKSHIWYCDCKHFHYNITRSEGRERLCYHIEACILHREKLYAERGIERREVDYFCIGCKSTIFNKNGTRGLETGVKRQRYVCKKCNAESVLLPKGFAGHRADPETIMDAMYLLMRGVSSRNIARQIEKTHSVKVAHTTIIRWVRNYTRMIKEYTDTLMPETSDVWSIDEAVVKVKKTEKLAKGFHVWLWNIIDPHTRFMIATQVSKKREIVDARKIIGKAKETGCPIPNYVISDSLQSYKSAIQKEFNDRVAHIETKAIRDGFTNRPVERYHNEIRENLKTRRGLGNDESAQGFVEMLQIYHNFIRPHMGLGGKTPAEAAGICGDLGEDKIASLLDRRDDMKKPQFILELGGKIKYVNVFNSEDSCRVVPKTWMRGDMWHMIDDVLKRHDFAWTSFGKNDGCWVLVKGE